MQTINLNNGKVALVDETDFELVKTLTWFIAKTGYVATNVKVDGKWKQITLHRLVNKTPSGLHTDHLNGNKLDNRKSNLRTVTQTENNQNMNAKPSNSGFRGVFQLGENKYKAVISIGNKSKHLGIYSTPKVAALAYNIASVGYRGKFARTNDLRGMF